MLCSLCGIGLGPGDIRLGRPGVPCTCDVSLDGVQVCRTSKGRFWGTCTQDIMKTNFSRGQVTKCTLAVWLRVPANQIFGQHGSASEGFWLFAFHSEESLLLWRQGELKFMSVSCGWMWFFVFCCSRFSLWPMCANVSSTHFSPSVCRPSMKNLWGTRGYVIVGREREGREREREREL